MIETRENASALAKAEDTPAGTTPSFDIPSNKDSDIFGLWPAELFEGFEEFVKECRKESGFGQEPPAWW